MRTAVKALALALALFQNNRPSGSVSGLVIKAGTAIQQPLQDAHLELRGGQGGPRAARTDAGGRFGFSDVPPGRYRLTVVRDGFIRQEHPKSLTVERGQNVAGLRFQL